MVVALAYQFLEDVWDGSGNVEGELIQLIHPLSGFYFNSVLSLDLINELQQCP